MLKDENTPSAIRVVIFRLHDEDFGVEIAYIREITAMLDMTVIHDPAGFIKGVVNYQGQVVVVVDWITPLCSRSTEGIPKTARIIFIELRKRVFGFIVDQVFDVIEVSLGDAGGGRQQGATDLPADYIKGVAGVDGKSIRVLDMEKIFLKFI